MDKIIEDICSEYERDQYAMYLRKSRADMEMEAMGEGETLKRHENMLHTLAAKHDIHPDQITIYREIVSGESISERPEMQKLLTDVYRKKYKGVLVVEVERLARGNTKDQGEVADAFQYSNTHIITPAKIYDPNNEFDQEYFEFGLFMSRREYKTIRRRLEAGKAQSVQEGNYISSVRIFGFDIERRSKKDRVLVKNEAEAKIVQMVFDWFTIDKKSTGWIATQLTKMGIPTITGNAEWNRGTVRDMLANVHYIGKVRWNQARTVKEYDHETGEMVKRRKRSEPEIYEGKHDGFIDPEQFNEAQKVMASHAPLPVNTEMRNPFSGLLKCCDCGRHISMHNYNGDNRTPRFLHPRAVLCKKKSLPIDVVVEAVVDALMVYIADFEVRMNTDNREEKDRHKDIIAALEAELSKQERKRKRLFDAYEEDETYTKEEFIERKQIVNAAIDALKGQLQEAKNAVPEAIDYADKIVTIHQMIDCIKNPDLSAKAKNDFLKQHISLIKYDTVDFGAGKGGKAVLDLYLK